MRKIFVKYTSIARTISFFLSLSFSHSLIRSVLLFNGLISCTIKVVVKLLTAVEMLEDGCNSIHRLRINGVSGFWCRLFTVFVDPETTHNHINYANCVRRKDCKRRNFRLWIFFLVRQMGKILFRKMFVILDFAGRTANVTNRCENHQKKSMR